MLQGKVTKQFLYGLGTGIVLISNKDDTIKSGASDLNKNVELHTNYTSVNANYACNLICFALHDILIADLKKCITIIE